MEMNDMVIVSVDDHIIEPPTMWDRHLPAKHRNINVTLVGIDLTHAQAGGGH